MKKQHFLTIIFLSLSIFSLSQEKYKTDIKIHEGFSFTTFLDLNIVQNQFTLTSSKDADKRAIGGFKSTAGRMLGKIPKKGILVTLNGIQKKDSLIGNAKVPVLGNLKFIGILRGNKISGNLLKNDNTIIANLNGIQTEETKIHYEHLYPKILKITQDNIYSKDVLQTKEWNEFKTKLERLSKDAVDDIEFFIGFDLLSQNLTFSHYNLIIQEDEIERSKDTKIENTVIFEEKTPETAYVKIKNFSSSQKEIAEIFPKISANKNYKNLIVDLRGNSGGGLEAAFEFGKHILNQETEVGYFVTNKFNKKDFSELSITKATRTSDFVEELKNGKGAKMIIPKSDNDIFLGKLYVLTDSKTASTCEPIVYVLKNTRRATIIGSNTAGAMLSAAPFEISGKYKLILPLADFYTYDNIRLDQIGVAPNIETEPVNALIKALELIKS